MANRDRLQELLKRHGIEDPYSYLKEKGETAKVDPSSDPDVRVRGSVQLMKQRKVSRSDVADGLAKLKHL